jgi:hypothetical protein
VVGIEEDTALVTGLVTGLPGTAGGNGAGSTRWQVLGARSVWLIGTDGRVRVPSGDSVQLARPG